MPNRVQLVVEKLESLAQSWRSVEVDVRTDQAFPVRPPDAKAVTDRIEEHYIETASGQRYLGSRSHFDDGTARRSEAYSDGSRCATVLYKREALEEQDQVTINRSFEREWSPGASARPIPLRLFYHENVPLHEALRKAEFVGESHVLGRACESFILRNQRMGGGKGIVLFKIDQRETIPLEVSYFLDPEAYAKGTPYHTLRVTKLETRQEHPIAIEMRGSSFDMSNPEQQITVLTVAVRSIAFDKDYPRSTFWPTFQPGVRVFDTLAGKSYHQAGARAEAKVKDPVRVAPEGSGWSPVPGITLGLGVAVLATGLVLRWRRG